MNSGSGGDSLYKSGVCNNCRSAIVKMGVVFVVGVVVGVLVLVVVVVVVVMMMMVVDKRKSTTATITPSPLPTSQISLQNIQIGKEDGHLRFC